MKKSSQKKKIKEENLRSNPSSPVAMEVDDDSRSSAVVDSPYTFPNLYRLDPDNYMKNFTACECFTSIYVSGRPWWNAASLNEVQFTSHNVEQVAKVKTINTGNIANYSFKWAGLLLHINNDTQTISFPLHENSTSEHIFRRQGEEVKFRDLRADGVNHFDKN